MNRPNVLVVVSDQLQRRAVGAYGNDVVETPNIDDLAARSAVFERAYCPQPFCTPSRSALLTGRYPHETGCPEGGSLPRSARCLPEFEAFADYATGYVGKWDLGDEVFPQHGFEEWAAIEDCYRSRYAQHRPMDAHSAYHDFLDRHGFEPDADQGFGDTPDDDFRFFSRQFSASLPERYGKPAFVADAASAFIRRHRDEPFCLVASFLEPHQPFRSPRDDQYDPGDVLLPPNFEHDGFTDQCASLRDRREAIERGEGDDLPGVYTGLGANPDASDWRDLLARYYGLVSLVDTHVGRILRTLSACGLEEDTIVVFTSDHGDHMGSHRIGGKRTLLEESAGVPLVVRVPGSDAVGTRVTRPVSQVDLVPTLLDAAGGDPPDRFHGESWMPWFRGGGELPPRDVFVESQFVDVSTDVDPRVERTERYAERWTDHVERYSRAIVTPDLVKYVYRPGDRDGLYDLDADPYETRNLAAEPGHQDTLDTLRERLRATQERYGDPLAGPGKGA